MTNKYIENELEQARLPNVELPRNREVTRNVLETTIRQQAHSIVRKRTFNVIFSAGLAAGFALGIFFVWMFTERPAQREATQLGPIATSPGTTATNLGTTWCTYSDRSSGGNSFVWPPMSTEGQNNFVKSAPGYGEKGYAVRFRGKAGERTESGFIGVRTSLGPPCTDSRCGGVNIQKFEKVQFKMKGSVSGGELVLQISNVEYNASDNHAEDSVLLTNDSYEAPITGFISDEWQTVTLDLRADFSSMAQPNQRRFNAEDILADAKNLKWHVRNGRGVDVDVWIDELEFY